jgi:S1-C subfamily serine protease
MRGAGNNISRLALIALCLAPFALQPALASAQDASASSPDSTVLPPSTTEIPPAVLPQSQSAAAPVVAPPDIYNSGAGIDNSQDQVPPAELRQEMQSLRDFMEDGDNTSSLGMVVREDHRGVDGNGEVAGLLVLEVMPGTPAAYAGLRGLHTGINSALSGAAFAASLFFPPAMLAAAVVSGTRIGESYDLIIGLDSERVTSYLDFSERMRQVRAGELVYLSVSRNGKRTQIPIKVPVVSAAIFGAP